LRATQDELVRTLLPRLRIDPDDPIKAFDAPISAVWLEIGFGGGEHLAARARAHPEIGFIGCEPFVNGVAKLLGIIHRDKLRNIRIWDAEATELLGRLPSGSIAGTYLLYPDPWPKRRHRKRRFVSDENLPRLARVMAPGAELRFTTDIDDYAGWALARVIRSGDFRWAAERPVHWRQPWPGWPGTRYETKAVSEGRRPVYLIFERT
jgi:tRNA (guanine-N7-)-methyltransferase